MVGYKEGGVIIYGEGERIKGFFVRVSGVAGKSPPLPFLFRTSGEGDGTNVPNSLQEESVCYFAPRVSNRIPKTRGPRKWLILFAIILKMGVAFLPMLVRKVRE